MAGTPLAGVQVFINVDPNARNVAGAASDANGNFVLDSVPAAVQIIHFRSIGYNDQTHTVRVMAGSREAVCAVLQETAIPLNH